MRLLKIKPFFQRNCPLLNISVHSVEIKRYRLRKNDARKKTRNCRVHNDVLILPLLIC